MRLAVGVAVHAVHGKRNMLVGVTAELRRIGDAFCSAAPGCAEMRGGRRSAQPQPAV
jgi:hypothetical protein